MKKLFLLATLLFGLLTAGCSENSGTQTSNNVAGFDGNNPALSINVEYTGKTNVKFSVSRFGVVLDDTYQYEWDFGDNESSSNTASSAVVEHNFTKENQTYNVSVNVLDSTGESVGKTTKSVFVSTTGVVQNANDIKITDTDDPLTKKFFSGAFSSDDIPLVYEWDFGDAKITGSNNVTHTFSKYGKTYTVTVKAINKASESTGEGTATVTTPAVDFYIQCTQNNKAVSCTPHTAGVTGGLKDIVYEWNFDVSKDNITTVGDEAAVFNYTEGGTKTITVTGTSTQIEGKLEATTTISIATTISLDQVECIPTNNLLEYTCSVNAMLSDNNTGTIAYKWLFDNVTASQTGNTATYKFAKFPPKDAPSYAVTVIATFGEDNASQSTKIEIPHPTVTVSKSVDSVNNQASLLASLSTVIDDAVYSWNITTPSERLQPTGPSQVIDLTEEGVYTATVTVTHSTFAESVVSAPVEINNSDLVKNLSILCPPVNGMHYLCTTNATATQVVNGVEQQIPLTYQWNIAASDGVETYSYDTRIINQKLKKYNETYRVNLAVIPQGDVARVYTAPEFTITTSVPTVSISKPASVIRVGDTVTFTANISGLIEDIQLDNATYKWYVGGVEQTSSITETFSHTFNTESSTDVRVEVSSASSLVGAISAQTSVTVGKNALLTTDISGLNVDCKNTNKEKNDIKKSCTVTFTNGTEHNAQIYLIPRGVDGKADGTPVVFNNGETKDVIFDWPALNIDTITNRTKAASFQGKLSVQLYSNGSKVGNLEEKTYTIQYPLASYEMYLVYEDFPYSIGTDAKFKFKKLNTNLTNITQEWYMTFNGYSGVVAKTFDGPTQDNQVIDFTSDMQKVRFAGTVKGNPFNKANGFGVKLSGGELSKPLTLYGVNTKQGISEDQKNAVGASLGNRGWISPYAMMFYRSVQYRLPTGMYNVPFQIELQNKNVYNTTGWDQFCIIGTYGYDKNGTLWSLPRAHIMPQNTSYVNKDDDNEYFTVLGYNDWTSEKGYIEQRTTYAQNGQPAVPSGYNMRPIGTIIEPKYYGFTGVHVGFMLKSGDLSSCVFAKKFDNDNGDKDEVSFPLQ